MRPKRFRIVVIAAALLLLPVYSGAQQASPAEGQASPTAATSATPAAPAAQAVIEPEAIAALKRSSEFLQTLKSFNIRVEASTDEVLDSGQKVQFGSFANISVVRPNRLRADVIDDQKQRQFYYDGKTLTVYGKVVNYYASVSAPKTIKEMLAFAESKYGLEWPLADLLAPESLAENVKSAFSVGQGRVGGVLCEHYAFRQDEVDWQIWIQTGNKPLPRKIVITSKNEEGVAAVRGGVELEAVTQAGRSRVPFCSAQGRQQDRLSRAGSPAGQREIR
jgi:hypothetical protein